MNDKRNETVLLAHFQLLRRQALQARVLLDRPAKAADAVYDLRLALRICRILRHFVRGDPDFNSFSKVLDLGYRATSPVRDRQVGIARIRQWEVGWPRNRRRPSTALAQALRKSYPQLGREMDVLGLPDMMRAMEAAIIRTERQLSPAKLVKRAVRHADKLKSALRASMRVAQASQRMKDWHRLRLAIKHYRFWVAALEPVLPTEHVEQAKVLKPLQVALGEAHDDEVLAGWLPEVPGAPLDIWLPLLTARKSTDMAQAQSLLTPLLACHGLVDCANGIS
jgi:CHAD domain-containing protein